jgi:TRAP-type transport system periplasmic protein
MRRALEIGLAFILAGLAPAAGTAAQSYTMNVVGGPSVNNPYRLQHVPFFDEELPAAAGDRLQIQLQAQDAMGLKGPEVVGLLSKGVVDVAYLSFNYIAGENPRMEGIDLPGMALDIADARAAAEAYAPIAEETLRTQHNAKLLNVSPVSLQVLYCKEPVEHLADFQGRKVRVFGVAMAEYFEAIGAVTVNMPFVEVLPALQRGVVDCAITSTINGNTARWWEVTPYMYKLGMGWGMVAFAANLDWWNELDPDTQVFLQEQFETFEDKLWAQAEADVQDGINCNTGQGDCVDGIVVPEANRMILSEPDEADRAEHKRLLESTVLPGWAERCGAECAQDWNETIGVALGLKATATQ